MATRKLCDECGSVLLEKSVNDYSTGAVEEFGCRIIIHGDYHARCFIEKARRTLTDLLDLIERGTFEVVANGQLRQSTETQKG